MPLPAFARRLAIRTQTKYKRGSLRPCVGNGYFPLPDSQILCDFFCLAMKHHIRASIFMAQNLYLTGLHTLGKTGSFTTASFPAKSDAALRFPESICSISFSEKI